MTQEEKAKAYDEAMKKIQPLYEQAKKDDNPIWSIYEHLFHELRESEDERIRRTLVEYFGPKVQLDFVRGIPIQKIRDWIEKQKEQKQTDLPAGFYYIDLNGNRYYSKEFRYGDMKLKVGDQKPLETPSPSVIYTEQGDVLAEQEPAWSEDIIRKAVKEIGLTQHQIDWFKTNVFPPKPEWSEEDEKMIEGLITRLNWITFNTRTDGTSPNITFFDEIDWLKSLRPQPKQEWSEELDTDTLREWSMRYAQDIRQAIESTAYHFYNIRPHWKPSEEQMGALSWMLENARGNIDFDPLKDLYEQLKKL